MSDKAKTSAAHTPGPWTVRDTGDAHCIYAAGSNRPFVTLYHANHGGRDKAAELAHLIASAPDLLAALTKLLGSVERLFPRAEELDSVADARAVLAKAVRS